MTSGSISYSHQLCTLHWNSPSPQHLQQGKRNLSPATTPKPPALLLNPRLYLLQHTCATLLPSPGQGLSGVVRRAEQAAAAPDRALASRGSPWPWGTPGYSGLLGKHVGEN